MVMKWRFIILTWIRNAWYDSMTCYFWVMQDGLMFCSTCITYFYDRLIYFCANLLDWSDGTIYFCYCLLDSWLFSDLLLFCILCDQCRQKTTDHMAQCKSTVGVKPCTQNFCAKCLLNRYVCVWKPFFLSICPSWYVCLLVKSVFFNQFSFSISLFSRRPTYFFYKFCFLINLYICIHNLFLSV